jgi:hypothetical protein
LVGFSSVRMNMSRNRGAMSSIFLDDIFPFVPFVARHMLIWYHEDFEEKCPSSALGLSDLN